MVGSKNLSNGPSTDESPLFDASRLYIFVRNIDEKNAQKETSECLTMYRTRSCFDGTFNNQNSEMKTVWWNTFWDKYRENLQISSRARFDFSVIYSFIAFTLFHSTM